MGKRKVMVVEREMCNAQVDGENIEVGEKLIYLGAIKEKKENFEREEENGPSEGIKWLER